MDKELTTQRDAFLDLFPTEQRGTICNWFLDPVRAGQKTVEAVLFHVRHYAQERARRAFCQEAEEKAQRVLKALDEHGGLAEGMARYALAYVSLPDAERQARKQARSEAYRRQWMADQPPTERQVSYLRVLGYDGPITDRHQASQLIETWKQRRA